MFAKSLASGLLLLLSVSTVHAGSAGVSLYSDINCGGTLETDFEPVLSGDGGCGAPITVAGFKSARLNWSAGLSAVQICVQGYSCDDGYIDLVPLTGKCVQSPDHGTWDKVRLCI
jgi:hypothetical protein